MTNVAFPSASLYVGDLQSDVSEGHLFDVFTRVVPVASIRVCRDAVTRRSLGYAYVNFHSTVDAEQALNSLNGTPIKGRPARIMWSQRDPSIRRSGVGNIFIKNLDRSIDHLDLYDTFIEFGNILSCKIATDETGASKGHGFVHYETREMAQNAIDRVNGMMLKGKAVYVGHFTARKERQRPDASEKFTNVFVKNLDGDIDEKKLNDIFSAFGSVTSALLSLDVEGKSKCFGFVNFDKHEDAAQAIQALHNTTLKEGGKVLYVGRAMKKNEREQEADVSTKASKYQGVNLYIKNLDDFIDDDRLKAEFAQFGSPLSAHVMKNEKGISKGFGFVSYTTTEEATRAVAEMNGRLVGSKPLYVALAQKKELRKAQLEQQFRQRGKPAPNGLAPLYPPPLFYTPQPPQGFMGYPPPIIPSAGITRNRWEQLPPGSAPPGAGGPQGFPGVPQNYIVPMGSGPGQQQPRQPRHQNQRNGGGGGGNRRGGYIGSGAGRGRDQSPQPNQQSINPALSLAGALHPLPQHLLHHQPPQQLQPQVQSHVRIPEQAPALTPTLLAQYPLDVQVSLLGEKIFPLIERVQPEHAGKITGMLLTIQFDSRRTAPPVEQS